MAAMHFALIVLVIISEHRTYGIEIEAEQGIGGQNGAQIAGAKGEQGNIGNVVEGERISEIQSKGESIEIEEVKGARIIENQVKGAVIPIEEVKGERIYPEEPEEVQIEGVQIEPSESKGSGLKGAGQKGIQYKRDVHEVGAFGPELPCTLTTQEYCDEVRSAFEEQSGIITAIFECLRHREQIVAGKIILALVRYGEGSYVMLKILVPLSYTGEGPILLDYLPGQTEDSPIRIF